VLQHLIFFISSFGYVSLTYLELFLRVCSLVHAVYKRTLLSTRVVGEVWEDSV